MYGDNKDAEGHRRSFQARPISEFVVGTEENYDNYETSLAAEIQTPYVLNTKHSNATAVDLTSCTLVTGTVRRF